MRNGDCDLGRLCIYTNLALYQFHSQQQGENKQFVHELEIVWHAKYQKSHNIIHLNPITSKLQVGYGRINRITNTMPEGVPETTLTKSRCTNSNQFAPLSTHRWLFLSSCTRRPSEPACDCRHRRCQRKRSRLGHHGNHHGTQ